MTHTTRPTLPSLSTVRPVDPQTAQMCGTSTTMDRMPAAYAPVAPASSSSIQRSELQRPSPSRSGTVQVNEFDARSLIRAIRRMDRKLPSRRVKRSPAPQPARGTKKRWSPASSKAYYARASRFKRGSLAYPEHIVAQPLANTRASRANSSWSDEATVCEA